MDKLVGANKATSYWEQHLDGELRRGNITKRQRDVLAHCHMNEERVYLQRIIGCARALYAMIEEVSDTALLARVIGETIELWNHRIGGKPLSKPNDGYLQVSRGLVDTAVTLHSSAGMSEKWMSDVDMIKEFIALVEEKKGFKYGGKILIVDIRR